MQLLICQECDSIFEQHMGRPAKRCLACRSRKKRALPTTVIIAVCCPKCAGDVVEENRRAFRAELVTIVRCVSRTCGYRFVARLMVVPAHADEMGDATKCGTEAGAQRHYRRGEEACDACRLAHAEKNKKRKAAA